MTIPLERILLLIGAQVGPTAFREEARLDYVLRSPRRIPIARLAAAQATLGRKGPSTA